ncbi:helix-turn-helix transcriptional regulator [Caproiciproducens sp. R2]|uniref:helix-turn-helix transcriptional regulator n=1 Tax=Caproiciproducens sp. R2 TaxID=3435187 RepID=UPI004033298F
MQINNSRLQLAMAKQGYNVSTLAEASKISRQSLSYILHGKDCRPDTAAKIADGLRIPIEDLIESKV